MESSFLWLKNVADCFYTIDLVAGDNAIEMNYEPGNVTVGIAMFICGVIGTLIISVIAKRKVKAK